MSGNRNKLSGHEYRKKAKENAEHLEKHIAKLPKLDSFVLKLKPNLTEKLNDHGDLKLEESSNYPEIAPSQNPENPILSSFSGPDNFSQDRGQEVFLPPNDNSEYPCNQYSHNISPVYQEFNSKNPSFSEYPAKWIINDATVEYLIKHGFNQHMDSDFSKSKRQYTHNVVRYMSKSLFSRKLQNGEVQPRHWLIYSESTNSIYCGPCKLFKKLNLFTTGYNDWKNAQDRVIQHEHSTEHKDSIMSILSRKSINQRIDEALIYETEKEINYWRNVLKRVVAAVKHLASRGLPFRGTEDKFGSLRSGNYVMALELIAEFDPFLSEHIKLHGNKGSGTTSYLSSFVCEEFIHIIGNNVLYEIVNKVKLAKYFSISVDSTPDVAHSDQLTFIIRYVSENGLPEEHFLKFIPNFGHKGEDMVTAILDVLAEYDLDVKNCRGQSYDNASNMSGLYSGVQARILELNPLAVYVPCAPHSLNLVGTNTVKSSSMVVAFFAILQQLYNFFSSSTHRWEILLANLKPQSSVVKNISKTRWSDQADACKSVCQSWNEILNVLSHIANDECEKPDTRQEALGLHNSLNSLDNCLIALLWNDILERFRVVSKALQAQDCHIILVVELYQSLITYVTNLRTEFDSYDEKAKNVCKQTSYKQDNSRKRKRKLHFDEATGTEHVFSGRDNMKINMYLFIIDRLVVELQRRCKAYELLQDRFAFLTLLQTKKSDEIKKDCQKLLSTYPNDLGEELKSECLHLSAHLKTLRIEKISATNLSAMLSEKGLTVVYPNFNIALRMYLSILVANCSGERSFSALSRVKNYLRSSMEQDRLNSLAILYIESSFLQKLDYDKIIKEFAEQKVRKVLL